RIRQSNGLVRGELETKHVRRRVDETKASIKIERITAEIGFEALRQDNLEDVARPNVLLGSLYCALELAPLKIGLGWMRFAICRWNKRKIGRFGKLPHDLVDRVSRSRIDFFDGTVIEERIRNDLQSAQPMIEDEKAACNHEDHLGQLQFIALCERNLPFEEMDRFIAEETNGATAESRQSWTRDKLIARHQL